MDLHCHLDLYPDALKLLPEVSRRNRFTLVVTTSPRAWVATTRVFAGHCNIEVAVGLHPEIAEQKAGERELLLQSIARTRFVGEIGIDGSSRFRATLPLQEAIFRDAITECAKQGGKIISIHSRGAGSRVLDILEDHRGAGKPILHWFTGTPRELRRAIEVGCRFSVSPAMLSTTKGRELLTQMPIGTVLPETDGPFTLAGGKPYLPWEAMDILSVLAKVWSMDPLAVASQLDSNLNSLLEQ